MENNASHTPTHITNIHVHINVTIYQAGNAVDPSYTSKYKPHSKQINRIGSCQVFTVPHACTRLGLSFNQVKHATPNKTADKAIKYQSIFYLVLAYLLVVLVA